VYASGGSIDAKGMLLRDALVLLFASVFVFAVLLDGTIHAIELVLLLVRQRWSLSHSRGTIDWNYLCAPCTMEARVNAGAP
jgi:hypothetical protein